MKLIKINKKFIPAILFLFAFSAFVISGCNSSTSSSQSHLASIKDTLQQSGIAVTEDTLQPSKPVTQSTIHTPLTLIIKNLASIRSPVYVSLYDSSNRFPSKHDHLKEYKFIADGNELLTEQINDLDYGQFAIATYQDLNDDGKCNRNLIGLPKEPYGFSNNFKPTIRAPHFDECDFAYNKNRHTLTIAMIR